MRRAVVTLTAVLVGASALAIAPVGAPSAGGEGDPTLALSVTEGPTGTTIGVTGAGCFLPDGVTGADGLLFQLVSPDGRPAASATLVVERDGTWDAPFVVPAGLPAGAYGVKGTCIAPMYEDLGVLTTDPFTVTGEGPAPAAAERAPATPRFPRQIEPYPAYDGQSRCSPAAKRGMLAFRDMLLRTYRGSGSFGISRDCGIGGTSEHKEGRAWDWAVDATTAGDRRKVANLMQWLLRTDEYGHRHAMARRLGIMYMIWNRRIFRLYRAGEGWTPYTGSSPHTDHVHFSLTRRGGAKTTSFWTLGLPGPRPNPPPTPDPPRPKVPRGPEATFELTEHDVRPTFHHVQVGDFDGDGRNDILWYGRGSKPDRIWWGRAGRRFTVRTIDVRGRYRPLVGDYDGDGRDDILWYTPGPGPDHIWYGRGNRRWDKTTIRIDARYGRSAVGDFDGDGRDDIFWYGPGDAPDKLWFGKPDRTFATRNLTVGGNRRPVVGDFDGDGRDDILLFGRGPIADELWFGRRDRRFAKTDRTIGQTRTPIVGDYNGNGRSDILWYAPGPKADKLWWGRRDRRFAVGKVTNVDGTYQPAFAGDLNDDGHDDVFWYRAGPAPDYIWWFR